MKKQICDLHCDTLYRARKEKISAVDNFGKTMLSLSNLSKYDNYIQVMAVWSDKRFSNDEAYDVFLDTAAYFKGQLAAAEYAGLKMQALSYKATAEINRLNLMQAVNNYKWAMSGVMSIT